MVNSEGICTKEKKTYETTRKVESGPCIIMDLDVLQEQIDNTPILAERVEVTEKLPELQTILSSNGMITIWTEEYYRSNFDEVSYSKLIPDFLAYYECHIGKKMFYGIIRDGNFPSTILSHLDTVRMEAELYQGIYDEYIQKIPHVFSNTAAAVVSHEILGHILELDNYYFYGYSNLINAIERLSVNVYDDPQEIKQLGLSIRDDILNVTQKTILFEGGKFTGELIGGSSKQLACARSFRRNSFAIQALPRMSTLIVESIFDNTAYPKNFVLITNIRRASVYHKTGKVLFYVTDANLVLDGNRVCKISEFCIETSIVSFLDKLKALAYSHQETLILQCLKKGQVINCGIKTNDWMLEF